MQPIIICRCAGRVRLRVLSTLLGAASTRFECDVRVSLRPCNGRTLMRGISTARTCNTSLCDVFDMDALMCTARKIVWCWRSRAFVGTEYDARSPRPRRWALIHFTTIAIASPTFADLQHDVAAEKPLSTANLTLALPSASGATHVLNWAIMSKPLRTGHPGSFPSPS
jgi:hypothetical protein